MNDTNAIAARAAADLMIRDFREEIAALENDTRADFILAWPDLGLAVKFHQDDWRGHQIAVCGVRFASPVPRRAVINRISNGHGDEAVKMLRSEAIAAQIVELRRLIADLEQDAA